MNMDLLLQTDNISKTFPGVRALDNLNLKVKSGEVHAIVGENGAGKSTLMNILSGVYTPDEGRIVFDQKDIILKSPKQAQDHGIVMIHQELSIATNITVMENVFIGRLPRNRMGFIRYQELYQSCQLLFQSIGIEGIEPDQMTDELSISEMQMVEIAKALSLHAKLIIMDEPTASLTHRETNLLLQIIKELKESGVSVLYISHRMEEVFAISDQITILRDGKYITTLQTDETSAETVIALMVGRELTKMFQRQHKFYESSSKPLLSVKGLSFGHKVKNVDMAVYPGEIVALTGLVGAGRTELVEGIFGVNKVNKGQILFEGKEVRINSPTKAIKLGISLLPEGRKIQGIYAEMSVRENISISALKKFVVHLFLSRKKEKVAVEGFVKQLEIRTTSIEKEIRFLSGGNQQKAIFARSLLTKPKLLFLDEPTHGVDVGAKREIYELINNLVKTNVGIVLISSELSEVMALADRILVMRDGEIVKELYNHEATQELIMSFATS